MHSATHLDNSSYVISDRAAGALCAVLGQKLPKWGWEKHVMLALSDGRKLNAWLQRTDLRACLRTDIEHKRGWRWALHGLRRDGLGSHDSGPLGRNFQFQPVNSTSQ